METIKIKNKADALKFLETRLSNAYVKPQVSFSVGQWMEDSHEFVEQIQKQLSDPILIVRSSAITEDSIEASNAGKYESIANVPQTEKSAIINAVNQVINSYENDDKRAENKVFIQGQIDDIAIVGVVFTCDLTSLAPYYIVNYKEAGGEFDSVTAGKTSHLKTYVRFKGSPNSPKNEFLSKLIKTVEELERVLKCDHLDIEFVINSKGQLYILQARPIVTKKRVPVVDRDTLSECLFRIHKKFEKLQDPHPHLYGQRTVLGTMPDWNPAEILGSKPRMLALSFYRELVTDSVWAYQRNNYGYKDLRSFPLLRILVGLAYIDVKVSFNSFIPKDINDDLSHKLVDYYLDQLVKSPKNHDKVEFKVVFSCYYLNLPGNIASLKEYGFDNKEIEILKASLLKLTNKILDPKEGFYLKDLEKIDILAHKQKEILKSSLSTVDKIYWLIQDCKRYGTLPFAGLARCGFVARQFLESFIEMNILSKDEYNDFMASLNTVTKQFAADCDYLEDEGISKDDFLDKYGHLRPGTYDILSKRYDEGFDQYFCMSNQEKKNHRSKSSNKKVFEFSLKQLMKIDSLLQEHKINISSAQLIDFIKKAIEGREYAKFVFTKSISDSMVLLEEFVGRYGITQEELSFLDLRTVLDLYASLTNDDVTVRFRQGIDRHREDYQLASALKLPQLLTDKNEIYDFFINETEPNFISLLRVSGEVVHEKDFINGNLVGKIVLIPSADPGYDWLFAREILGLITMYGGANSHMAIRAAELGLPAVIGAGEQNFNHWSKAKILDMDCPNKQVTVVR